MITKGYITALDGEKATVRIHRLTACETCHHKDDNGACHAELMLSDAPRTLIVSAYNEVGAKVGDLVEVVTDESKALGLSFLSFVVPLLLAGAAYWLVSAISHAVTPATVTALCVFAVSFAVCLFAANTITKRHVRVIISKILKESEA